MKIKLIVIDLELSRRARQLATLAVVGALALGGAAIAYAGAPHLWNDGDTLTAVDLNEAFGVLDRRVTAVEQVPTPAITAWASYDPTVTANGTDVSGSQTTTAFWRRVGDTIEVRFVTKFSSCPFAGQLQWSLPPTIEFDIAKTATFESIGAGLAYGPGTKNLIGTLSVTALVGDGMSVDRIAIEMDGAPGGGVTCGNVGSGGEYRAHFAAAVKGWNVTSTDATGVR